MSIIYCGRHGRKWDSDRLDMCPDCESGPPVPGYCNMVGCNNKATRGTPPTWCASCAASIMFDVERPDLNIEPYKANDD